jgi:hypothetical protein
MEDTPMKIIYCQVCNEPCGKQYPSDQTDPGFREGIGENFSAKDGVWHCSQKCLDVAEELEAEYAAN